MGLLTPAVPVHAGAPSENEVPTSGRWFLNTNQEDSTRWHLFVSFPVLTACDTDDPTTVNDAAS